jgi:hypothetical protein
MASGHNRSDRQSLYRKRDEKTSIIKYPKHKTQNGTFDKLPERRRSERENA